MRKQFAVRRTAPSGEFTLTLSSGNLAKTWRIPRGPSLDPSHKRSAYVVSDSSDVRGTETWDEGTWTLHGDESMANSRDLEITVRGFKIYGRFRLSEVRGSTWRLQKLEDDYAIPGADADAIDRTLKELTGTSSVPATAKAAPATSASKLQFVPLALATLADAPPTSADWIHEVKLDGYRIEALADGANVRLMSRNAKDWTQKFPEVAAAVSALDLRNTVLDGEIVAINDKGVSSFQLLQQSLDQHRTTKLRYYVFDILVDNGTSLLGETLAARLPKLDAVLRRRARSSLVQPVGRFDPAKGNVLDQACRAGEEGVVSKRLDARYIAGRGRSWLKVKCAKRQEFVVVGYTDPQGSRTGFGSLLLAVMDRKAGGFVYTGRVGTGFDETLLTSLYRQLRRLEIETSPLVNKPTIPLRAVHWVKPELVAEVVFTEWTDDGLLRHPSFKGLREDKRPQDIYREDT